jgi:hypothetical protein
MEMTEHEAYQQYNDMLDEMYPLEGIACNPFSTLLREGDPVAYDCGFADYCDTYGIELED